MNDQLHTKYQVTVYFPDGSKKQSFANVQEESLLNVSINGQHAFSTSCSADHIKELVIGRLYTNKLICGIDDIASISFDEDGMRVDVQVLDATSADIRPSILDDARHTPEKSCKVTPIEWDIERVFSLARLFAEDSPLHSITNGSHSCYLSCEGELLYCREDLGRHNAFDKVIGSALLDGVDLRKCIAFSSGRVPTDMVMKAICSGIPVFVSKAVPTSQTIEIARAHDLTLICCARPDSVLVFNDPSSH